MADIDAPPGRIGTGETFSSLTITGNATFLGDLAVTGSAAVGSLATSGFISLGTPSELTIASGVITAVSSFHKVDTQSNDPTDDLDTINGGSDGDILYLRAANDSRTVVVKDATGNLRMNGDFSLTSTNDMLKFISVGGTWVEVSRSDNNA